MKIRTRNADTQGQRPPRAAHTPEPWKGRVIDGYENEPWTVPVDIVGGDATSVLDFDASYDGAWMKPADLRRVLACVNACAGLSTEALEAGALRLALTTARAALSSTAGKATMEAYRRDALDRIAVLAALDPADP